MDQFWFDTERSGQEGFLYIVRRVAVEQSKKAISLHLDQYVAETLDEYQKYVDKSLRPKTTPMQPGNVLHPDDSPLVPDKNRQAIYRSMVARLQYAATWVRFDISFTVAQLARFCASAGPSHWAALHHVMEYLAKKPSLKLTYHKQMKHRPGLDGFCDADWGNSSSRRSTTGLLFRYDTTPIFWRSKLQKSISLSTAEAEYYAASHGAVEAIYLRRLLDNMGFKQKEFTPLYEDNNACIEWANNVIGGRERAKHIDLRKHFAHEKIQEGHIRMIRVDTSDQLADVFTKSLQPPLFDHGMSRILGSAWSS